MSVKRAVGVAAVAASLVIVPVSAAVAAPANTSSPVTASAAQSTWTGVTGNAGSSVNISSLITFEAVDGTYSYSTYAPEMGFSVPLRPGTYRVFLRDAFDGQWLDDGSGRNADDPAAARNLITVREGEVVPVNLFVHWPSSLSVQVANAPTGRFDAQLIRADGLTVDQQMNYNGQFNFYGLQPGEYRLRFLKSSDRYEHSAYPKEQWYGGSSAATATPILVSYDEELTVDAVLQSGADVAGRVARPSSKPNLRIDVDAYQGKVDGNEVAHAQVEKDGTYRLTGLGAGTYTVVFTGDDRKIADQYWTVTIRQNSGSMTLNTTMKLQQFTAISPPRKVKAKASAALPGKTLNGSKIKWKSTNTSICRISNGRIVGVKPGSCTLTAKAKGNATYQPINSGLTIRVYR